MESAANGSTLMKDKDHQPPLFDPSDLPPACAKTGGHMIKPLPYPLWTKHKATLIARYLYYFVLITKHGTYIDGFSGPQKKNHPEMWAAKLVIECQPRRLRHFHFVEINGKKITALKALKAAEDAAPARPRRSVDIYHGDFNTELDRILSAGSIKPREAAFLLARSAYVRVSLAFARTARGL